jgi:hypothetical protein
VAPVVTDTVAGVTATATAGAAVPGALIVKLALVAEVRFGLVAESVYPLPAVLTVRLLKVATPFWGMAVSVPARPVPPARESVTGFVAEVTVFPLASSTVTWTPGVIVAFVNAFVGC